MRISWTWPSLSEWWNRCVLWQSLPFISTLDHCAGARYTMTNIDVEQAREPGVAKAKQHGVGYARESEAGKHTEV